MISASSRSPSAAAAASTVLETRQLGARVPQKELLRGITLLIPERSIFGIVGPSGAGKSTLLRCLNRLMELVPGARITGEAFLRGSRILGPHSDPDVLRTRIGMLFQQPVVFPRSIEQNVAFGARHLGLVPRRGLPELAERALRDAALWDEVKDRLHQSALKLSLGQQQRLCLARTLATQPDVILLDEPTSALDPKSTEAIEDLLLRLKERHTLVLVTHNLRQAGKLAERLAFLGVRDGAGQILCQGSASEVLDKTAGDAFEAPECCE